MTSSTTITVTPDTLTMIVGDDETMAVSTRDALAIVADAYRAELTRRGHDDVEVDVDLATGGAERSSYEDPTIHDRVLVDGADALRAEIVA